MRVLALDVGDKNIGVAVSDEMEIIATPLKVIKNDNLFLENLLKIIDDKNIKKIVVGIPYTLRGEIGHQAKKVNHFIENIKKDINIEIILIDERFTTQISETLVNNKDKRKNIDMYSAAVILENFLNNEKNI